MKHKNFLYLGLMALLVFLFVAADSVAQGEPQGQTITREQFEIIKLKADLYDATKFIQAQNIKIRSLMAEIETLKAAQDTTETTKAEENP